MLYEMLLALHITVLVGWAGLSTGGYHVAKSQGISKRYLELVWIQFISAWLLFASGLSMAVLFYNFPKSPLWIHYSIGVAVVAGLIEVYHVVNARGAAQNRQNYNGDKLIPMWVFIYFVMMYLMIFKPA